MNGRAILRAIAATICFPVMLVMLVVGGAQVAGQRITRIKPLTDPTLCFHGFGENLRLCGISQDAEGRLLVLFESPIRNAWFQTAGDGVVEVWFNRADIGDAELAQVRHLIAGPDTPEPGMGIGYDPGYVAARVTGAVVTIEDVVYDYPDGQ